jgi:hypothetical protein
LNEEYLEKAKRKLKLRSKSMEELNIAMKDPLFILNI